MCGVVIRNSLGKRDQEHFARAKILTNLSLTRTQIWQAIAAIGKGNPFSHTKLLIDTPAKLLVW